MFFRKKLTEEQLETTSLWAAEGLYRDTLDEQVVVPEALIQEVLGELYAHQKLTPSVEEMRASTAVVFALLAEGVLIKEFCVYREKYPTEKIPSEYSRRLKEVVKDFVQYALEHD